MYGCDAVFASPPGTCAGGGAGHPEPLLEVAWSYPDAALQRCGQG